MAKKPEPFNGDTLTDARLYVQDNCGVGIECPCCQQYVKKYARHIHASMALMLIELHKYFERLEPEAWLHVSRFPKSQRFNINGNYSMLRFWGLLEPHPEETGYWRVTDLGRQFVRGEVRVAETIWLLNNIVVAVSEQLIDIKYALGNEFDYDEIMGETVAA